MSKSIGKQIKTSNNISLERDIIILAAQKASNGKDFYTLEIIAKMLSTNYSKVQNVVSPAIREGKISRDR
ncbi:MAG: hypothetical protein ACRCZ2_08030 [Fusobacteriaceae bacterium]